MGCAYALQCSSASTSASTAEDQELLCRRAARPPGASAGCCWAPRSGTTGVDGRIQATYGGQRGPVSTVGSPRHTRRGATLTMPTPYPQHLQRKHRIQPHQSYRAASRAAERQEREPSEALSAPALKRFEDLIQYETVGLVQAAAFYATGGLLSDMSFLSDSEKSSLWRAIVRLKMRPRTIRFTRLALMVDQMNREVECPLFYWVFTPSGIADRDKERATTALHWIAANVLPKRKLEEIAELMDHPSERVREVIAQHTLPQLKVRGGAA